MQITITIKRLEEAGACEEAVKAFREIYGESGTETWTRDRQIAVLKGPLGKFIGWAWANGLLPLWNLSGANLSRANLYGVNLSGADLSGANLYGVNLSRADLSGANLSGADLSRADLSGANLFWANLSRVNLSRADLSGANLYDCYCPEDAPDGWEKQENGRLRKKEIT